MNDDIVIQRACEACQDSSGNVKVEDVVTMLLNDDSIHPKTKVILNPILFLSKTKSNLYKIFYYETFLCKTVHISS